MMAATTTKSPSPQSWSQVVKAWPAQELPEFIPGHVSIPSNAPPDLVQNTRQPNIEPSPSKTPFFATKLEALNPVVRPRCPETVPLQTCARIFDQLVARQVVHVVFQNQITLWLADQQEVYCPSLAKNIHELACLDPEFVYRLNNALANHCLEDAFPDQFKLLNSDLVEEVLTQLPYAQATYVICECCGSCSELIMFECSECGRMFVLCHRCVNNMQVDPPDYDSCCLAAFAIAVLSPAALRREKDNLMFLLAARRRNDKDNDKSKDKSNDNDMSNKSDLVTNCLEKTSLKSSRESGQAKIEQDQFKTVRKRRGGRNHKKA